MATVCEYIDNSINVSMALTIDCSIPTASAKHIIDMLNMHATHKKNIKLRKSCIQTPNAIQHNTH